METPENDKKEEPKGSPGYVRFIKDNSLILFIFYLLNRVDGLEKSNAEKDAIILRHSQQESDALRRITRRLIDKGLGNDIAYRDSLDRSVIPPRSPKDDSHGAGGVKLPDP